MADDQPKDIDSSIEVGENVTDSNLVMGKNNTLTQTGGGQSGGRDQALVHVNVYDKGGTKPRPRRRRDSMATIEEKLRDKLNQHDVKLERLDIVMSSSERSLKEYIDDLRNDVAEIKVDLKPLIGMNILAANSSKATDEDRRLATEFRQWFVVVAIALVIIAIGLIMLVTFLALGGRSASLEIVRQGEILAVAGAYADRVLLYRPA